MTVLGIVTLPTQLELLTKTLSVIVKVPLVPQLTTVVTADAVVVFNRPKNKIEIVKVIKDLSLLFINEVLIYPLFISICGNK